MAPAYNETIHGLIRERISSGARLARDTTSSHSLTSAFLRSGLIAQYPSFLISGGWIANHWMSSEIRFGACFQDAPKEVLWLLECRASNL